MASKVKRFTGNQLSKAQVLGFSPAVVSLAPNWSLTLNGKTITVVSNGTTSDAVTKMQAAWSASQEPEFQEIQVTVSQAGNTVANPQGTGTNEINSVYISGVPTAGSFQLSWEGSATAFIPDPTAALSAADNATSGNPNGAYKYTYTFLNVNPLGVVSETKPSPEATVTVTNHEVALTSIPLGPNSGGSVCIGRRIYRTPASGATGTEALLWTIWDNTTTTYLDNIADGSLGAAQPTSNMTGIPYNATAAQLQNILQELLAFGPNTVIAYGSGTAAAPWLIQWVNVEGAQQIKDLIIGVQWSFNWATTVPAAITPQVLVTEIQQGVSPNSVPPANGAVLVLTGPPGVPFYVTSQVTGVIPPVVDVKRSALNTPTISVARTGAIAPSISITDVSRTTPSISIVRQTQGVDAVNEVQAVSITGSPLLQPPAAPYNSSLPAGVIPVGKYIYCVTLVNANGETSAGAELTVDSTVVPATASNISLANIPLGPQGTTARKIYRTLIGGATGTEQLVTTISNNTATTYTDSTLDGSLGAAVPTINTTGNPPTGGTFTLTFGANTTTGIAYNAAASAVQSALVALASIGAGNAAVVGTGTISNPWLVTFQGALAGPQVLMTGSATSLQGSFSVQVTEQQHGGTAANEIQVVGYETPGTLLSQTPASPADFILIFPGPSNNTVLARGIPYNATAAQMLAAMQTALGSLGTASSLYSIVPLQAGGIVSGDEVWSWQITYTGLLGDTNLPQATLVPYDPATYLSNNGTTLITGITWTAGAAATSFNIASSPPTNHGIINNLGHYTGASPFWSTTQDGSPSGIDELQVITIVGGTAQGGTFTLTFGANTTTTIVYNASAATVQTALQALGSIGSGNATVTGSAGGPWTVDFTGTLAGAAQAFITGDASLVTGGTIIITEQLHGVAGVSAVDLITITNGVAGTFGVIFSAVESGQVAYNASAATLQTALQATSSIGSGNMTVTGSAGGPWTTTAAGTLANRNIGPLTPDGALLAASLVDTVTLNAAFAGTFGLTFNGQETAQIAYNASAATVQSALRAVSTIGSPNATVSGSAGGPYTVTLDLPVAKMIGDIGGDASALTNSITDLITLTNAVGGNFTLAYNGQTTLPIAYNASAATVQTDLSQLSTIGASNVVVTGSNGGPYTAVIDLPAAKIVGDITGNLAGTTGTVSYVITLFNASGGTFELIFATTAFTVFVNKASGGTFTLTYGDQTTGTISYAAGAGTVQAALVALSNVGSDNSGNPYVTVQGNGTLASPWLILFTGNALVNGKPLVLTANNAALTPAGSTVTIESESSNPPPGSVTAPISTTAAASTVQTDLTGLATIGSGNATVSGVSGGPWTATLTLPLAQLSYGLVANVNGLVGSSAAASGYPVIYCYAIGPNFFDANGNWADGSPPSAYLPTPPSIAYVIPLGTDGTLNAGTHGSLANQQTYYYKVTATNANGETTAGTEGSGTTFAGSKVTLNGAPTGGTFTLTYNAQTTTGLAYNCVAADVQAALRALSSVTGTNAVVTGSGTAASPWICVFSGSALNNGVPYPLSASAASLTPANSGTISIQNIVNLTLAVWWNEVPNATGYKLYRGTVTNTENVLLATLTSPDQTTFNDDGTYTTTSASPPTDANAWHTAVGDAIYTNESTVNISYNIEHSIVNGYSIHGSNGIDPYRGLYYFPVASLTSDASYSGRIGLSIWNPLGYEEYRPVELSIVGPPSGTFNVNIGNGNGSGSSLICLDTGTCQVAGVVNKMAGATTDPQALLWIGSNASTEWDLFLGTMGIAIYPGQTFTLSIVRQAYQTNKSSDTTLEVGAGGTVPTLYKNGGDTLLHGNVTTLSAKGGTITQDGGTVGTLDLEDTTYYSKSVGEITALKVTNDGVFDRRQDSRPLQVAAVSLYAGATYLDPHGATYTSSPGTLVASLIECGIQPQDPTGAIVDLGRNTTLTRVQN